MSELPELPARPHLSRPLPDGGLERAIAGGRRRRARFLAATAGGGALAGVLVAVLVVMPPARDGSLQVASPGPAPTVSAEPAPEPSETPTPPAPSGEPSSSAPVASEDAAQPEASPSAAPADADPSPDAAGPSAPPVADRPAYREATDEDAEGTEVCNVRRVPVGGSACGYTGDNGPVVRRGTPVSAVSGFCSGVNSAGDNVFEFSSGQETELVVRRGQQEVFRFSSTVDYVEGPHERRLRPGRCLEWRQAWRAVDTAGSPVPNGEYRVEFTIRPSGERYDFEDGRSERQPPQVNAHSFDVTIVD